MPKAYNVKVNCIVEVMDRSSFFPTAAGPVMARYDDKGGEGAEPMKFEDALRGAVERAVRTLSPVRFRAIGTEQPERFFAIDIAEEGVEPAKSQPGLTTPGKSAAGVTGSKGQSAPVGA